VASHFRNRKSDGAFVPFSFINDCHGDLRNSGAIPYRSFVNQFTKWLSLLRKGKAA
jgi:hypothetical protein